jgi:hypothetical protein
MIKKFVSPMTLLAIFAVMILGISPAFASEADLVVPSIQSISKDSYTLLLIGLGISVAGLIFGLVEFLKIKKLDVHEVMNNVGNTIFETCKTYLVQQGKFLLVLEVLIGLCIAFYFGYLNHMGAKGVLTILAWSVIGILGSYAVAWFGIRMNTLANSRTAFAALKGNPLNTMNIPLKAGMSIGVLLVSVELIMMLTILLFVPIFSITTYAYDTKNLQEIELCTGGMPFGVKISSPGLTIVRFTATKGKNASSAYLSGLREGDIITHVNGVRVKSIEGFIKEIDKAGASTLSITAQRNGKEMNSNLSHNLPMVTVGEGHRPSRNKIGPRWADFVNLCGVI